MTADAETREEVLAEVREVLALLKGQAANPLVRLDAPAPDCLQAVPSVPWDAPPSSTPEADLLEALRARRADATLTLPEGLTVQHVGPTPAMLQLLERLTYLLGLSDLEREFFEACASDEMMDAFDGRLAYADWLEERGDEEAGLRVRKLTPQAGDVLAFTLSRNMGNVASVWMEAVMDSLRLLERRGIDVTAVVLPHGARLDQLSEAQMADLGWVRAERVKEANDQGWRGRGLTPAEVQAVRALAPEDITP